MRLHGKLAILFAVTLGLGGCATGVGQAPGDYEALAARAEREIKRADEKGFLWLHTESYLAQSRQAYTAGNREEAVHLAQRALGEALLAQKQAADSATFKPDFTYRR